MQNILLPRFFRLSILVFLSILTACQSSSYNSSTSLIEIIIDTDANNELDDQHALAYAFCNSDIFDIKGVTVNNTRSGDGIEGHYKEALRIAKLCKMDSAINIYKGASRSYYEIVDSLVNNKFDGSDAVDFIVKEAHAERKGKLILVPIGKLTNIALAIKKDPSIVEKIKVVWLGSNYPDPGEYNLENDTSAINPVIQSGVEFELAIVAYGKDYGTAAVTVPLAEIETKMPGIGPEIEVPIEGRNGGLFNNFGDYAVNLWQNIDLYGEMKLRSLFDLAAVAVVKNPEWCTSEIIPAPLYISDTWTDNPQTKLKIVLLKNYNKEAILEDFYSSLIDYSIKNK